MLRIRLALAVAGSSGLGSPGSKWGEQTILVPRAKRFKTKAQRLILHRVVVSSRGIIFLSARLLRHHPMHLIASPDYQELHPPLFGIWLC